MNPKIITPDGEHRVLAVGRDKTGTFVLVENDERLATLWHRKQLIPKSRTQLDGLVRTAGFNVLAGGRTPFFINAVDQN
jgi:hypothetical protein